MAQQPLSFKIPNGRTEEVVLIQMPDGRVIARTRAEVAAMPEGLRDELAPSNEPPK